MTKKREPHRIDPYQAFVLMGGQWRLIGQAEDLSLLHQRTYAHFTDADRAEIRHGDAIIARWVAGARVGLRSDAPVKSPKLCIRCDVRYPSQQGYCMDCWGIISATTALDPYVALADRYPLGTYCALHRSMQPPLVRVIREPGAGVILGEVVWNGA